MSLVLIMRLRKIIKLPIECFFYHIPSLEPDIETVLLWSNLKQEKREDTFSIIVHEILGGDDTCQSHVLDFCKYWIARPLLSLPQQNQTLSGLLKRKPQTQNSITRAKGPGLQT